jgi:hypothetical protein
MKEGLQEALAWSLDELEHGRMSIEDCLARYPEHRQELHKLLLTAENLQQAPGVNPSLDFKLHARKRLINRLGGEDNQSVTFGERFRRTVRGRQRPTSVQRRPAMSWLLISAIVLSIFTGGGVGVAYAADGAAPGDALYGIDLGVESLRYNFALSQETKAELALSFADERLEELQELLGEGASGEHIGQVLSEYAHNLQLAVQAMNMVLAGEGEQAGETLRLLIQERLMLQNQLLTQIRNQTATHAQGQVEDAIRTMETTRSQVEAMASNGQGGPSDEGQGGPPDDGQGGQQEGGPSGPNDDPGGNPDAGPSDGNSGEGQQEAQQGSEATPFEKENEALRACMDEVEALVTQGDTDGLSQAAVRCGETVEGMVASIQTANQGDTQQAAVMAGMLNETLDEAIPRLNSLLANAPESAGTYIHQILAACEYGKEEMGHMGYGDGQGGPGDPQGPGQPGGGQPGGGH